MKTAETLISFENEIAIGTDDWAQIAPLGDFPGMAFVADGKGGFEKKKAIQRMDQAAVAQMANEYENSRRGISKFLTSRPLYVGHPDAPGGAARWTDKSPKGVFASLAARENGLFGQLILTEEGEKIVASKEYRALSGRWDAEIIGQEKGVIVCRPTKFLSAGLTNYPNLPVQLLNEAEAETQNTKKTDIMKKEAVIALLMGLGVSGITIANEASDDQISEALKQLGAKAKTADTLTGEKTTLANEKAQLEGKVTTLTTEKATATTERDTARTQFANERKGRITDLLDQAVRDGRIPAADRSTWETRLGNEITFANESEALKKQTPTIKTTSVTLQRGDRKVEISNANERREMVVELVNERQSSTKCSYDEAYAYVQKNYPQLFAAMEHPEIRKGGLKRA